MNLELFRELFIVRDDVYAEQQADGSYWTVRRPLTDDELVEHFAGMATYGTYTTEPATNNVRWVCFDLDTEDPAAREHLVECVGRFVAEAQVPTATDEGDFYFECLLLEDSNGQGRTHVWLFLSEPLPAAQVRAWVHNDFMPLWLCQGEMLQGADWPLEVFPKQDEVLPGSFGNLVRLPFGRNRKTGLFSKAVALQGWASSPESVQRLDSGCVPKLAPGEQAVRSRGRRLDGSSVSTPFPCIDACKAGVGEGQRDAAMYRLGVFYRTHGVEEDIALEQMLRDNEQFQPPLTEREVRRKCASAYGPRQAPLGCDEFLRGVCPGGEDCKSGIRPSGRTAVGRGGLRYEDMDEEQRREHRRKLREGR